MSHVYYMKLFKDTEKFLDSTVSWDLGLINANKKIKDPILAHSTVFTLYMKYIFLIKNLDLCYDQIVQPQKRPLVRKLLDMCIGRMLELKNEMINMDMWEYSYDDNALIEQKMTPWDIEIVVPRYFVHEREEENAQWKQLMAEIDERLQAPPPALEEPEKSEEGIRSARASKSSSVGAVEKKVSAVKAEKKASGLKAVEGEPKEDQEEEGREGDGQPPGSEEVAQVEVEKEKDPEMTESEIIKSNLPPPVIELTPQRRRELRKEKEDKRAAERTDIAMANEEVWLKDARIVILMIQIAERARQGRYRHSVAETIVAMRKETEKMQRGEKPQDKITDEEKREAATKIQRAWRRYKERKQLKKRELDLMMLTGMVVPSWRSIARQDRVEEVRRLRYDVQDDNLVDFIEDQRLTKKYYEEKKKPWLFEDYTDEIRAWFIEWYTKARCFPEFPKEEDGGSLLVAQGLVKTPEQYIKEQEAEEANQERNKKKAKAAPEKPKKTKEQIKAEKKAEKEKAEKKKRDEEKRKEAEERADPGFKMKESVFLGPLEGANLDYKSVWAERNERSNPLQKHYMDMVEVEKVSEVEIATRKAADEMMRLELERLNAALKRDIAKRKKGKKGKKGKGKGGGGGGKKKKGKKKGKGKKGKKKKKDPTADKTTEELFTELYENGIIRSYPQVKLTDFFGDHSYTSYDYVRKDIRPLHSIGDVRNLVNQYCILPIGSPLVHQLAPLIKSVCIIGPPGSGKHLLANAICTALGAIMFDLSPQNLADKYEEKADKQMLLHLVTKMSKLLQPSVIFIDGAEKPWYKKVPKPEKEMQPKKFAKQIGKIIKGITQEDRVLVLGISDQPWAAKPRGLVKAFNKFIVIPRADYGNNSLYWQNILMKYHNVDRNFDISSLAKVTEGYTFSQIQEVVKNTMTEKRIIGQFTKPLSAQELFEGLIDVKPITKEMEAKYFDWYNKRTPLGKKITKILKERAEQKEREEKIKKQAKS